MIGQASTFSVENFNMNAVRSPNLVKYQIEVKVKQLEQLVLYSDSTVYCKDPEVQL